MGGLSNIAKAVLAKVQAEERQRQEKLAAKIAAGPPVWSGLTRAAWDHVCHYGLFPCPGLGGDRICDKDACRLGSRCATMAAKSLRGNGRPMPKAERPACGAKTRAGRTCVAKVVPGKTRCRLHGGLSTGPKTAGGIERIRQAQARRWGRASKKAADERSDIVPKIGTSSEQRSPAGRPGAAIGVCAPVEKDWI